MNPLRTGLTFATTVGLFYALCTLVWVFAPGPFLAFMNGLFHGLDFSALARSRPFAFPGFLIILLVFSSWAFCAGAFFAWLSNRWAR